MRHYKKKETDPKIYRVTVRFNKDSYEKVFAMAKAANLSMAELIRQMVLKGSINIKQEIVAEVPMLKKLIGDFGKIGSNLNQIAHHYNGGGVRSREMYERTQRAISELYALKYEVERMGGEFRGYSEACRKNKQQRL